MIIKFSIFGCTTTIILIFVQYNFTILFFLKVTSDNRVKLEQKLREAGLHTSNYARQMLKQVAPPQAPRRDMVSNVFKYDEK